VSKPASMPAQQVLTVLREKHFRDGAYAMLREVRNRTGYGRERYADALVISLWPSRGIYFAGVEVKVSRGDWLSELRQPEKSAEIQKFCRYWWVATPPGVVEEHELPETWGHIEVTAKCKVTKAAPALKCEEPTATFVASVLRNAAQNATNAESVGYNRGYAAAVKEYSSEDLDRERLEHAQLKVAHSDLAGELERVKKEQEQQRAALKDFEQRTGLALGNRWWREHENVALVKAARALEGANLVRIADNLRGALERLDGAVALLPKGEARGTPA
jgi:hypothetical protein